MANERLFIGTGSRRSDGGPAPTWEPELYKQLSRAEAIAAFSGGGGEQELCDGQWVIHPDHILCFATVGEPPAASYFQSASRFCWAAEKPYTVADGKAFEQFLPKEVRADRKVERQIRLFVRRQGEDRYTFVGRLGPSHCFGSGAGGKNFGEAYFELQPSVPSKLWADLGGLVLDALDHGALDAALDRLATPLSVPDRLGILRALAEYFHGPISEDDGLSDDDLRSALPFGASRIPEALRSWYRLVGNRAGMLCCQNYYLLPSQLQIDTDDRLLFYWENQGVYLWATMPRVPAERPQGQPLFEDWVDPPCPLSSDDPPVWGRFNEPGNTWVEEGMRLSEFLIQVCLFESIMAAPYGASAAWINEDSLAKIIARLKELPIPPWHWPAFPTRFFYRNGAFAHVSGNGESDGKRGYSIWVGAKTEQPLAFLKAIVDDGWEYVAC